jgi:uncharacterized protein YerC
MGLNNNEMDHIKRRIDDVCKCTNGEIATIMNQFKVGTHLTKSKKYKLIKEGKAFVKTEHELVKIKKYSSDDYFDALIECFDYPETENQQDRREFNERVQRKAEELMQEVTLEGKRIIDNIVLGITELKDVPNELHRLGSMTSIARQYSPSHFKVPSFDEMTEMLKK